MNTESANMYRKKKIKKDQGDYNTYLKISQIKGTLENVIILNITADIARNCFIRTIDKNK